MNKLIGDIQDIPNHWGVNAHSDSPINRKDGIDGHIDEILDKHKCKYSSYDIEYRDNCNHYECFFFAFIDNNGTLHVTSIEITKGLSNGQK